MRDYSAESCTLRVGGPASVPRFMCFASKPVPCCVCFVLFYLAVFVLLAGLCRWPMWRWCQVMHLVRQSASASAMLPVWTHSRRHWIVSWRPCSPQRSDTAAALLSSQQLSDVVKMVALVVVMVVGEGPYQMYSPETFVL